MLTINCFNLNHLESGAHTCSQKHMTALFSVWNINSVDYEYSQIRLPSINSSQSQRLADQLRNTQSHFPQQIWR